MLAETVLRLDFHRSGPMPALVHVVVWRPAPVPSGGPRLIFLGSHQVYTQEKDH